MTFPGVKVEHHQQAATEGEIDEWGSKKTAGFRLSWFVEDANGSRMTERNLGKVDWQPDVSEAVYHDPLLEKMILMAGQARLKNLSSDEIVEQAIRAKVVLTEFPERSEWCDNGQVVDKHMKTIFEDTISMMNFDEDYDDSILPLRDEDVLTGFRMFAAIAHCPSNKVFKLYKFFRTLVSTQNLKTILKATVNTIAGSNIRKSQTLEKVHAFYDILEETLKLQYGAILLATSNRSKQQMIIEEGFPFTAKHKETVQSCFNGTSCNEMKRLLKGLGKK